MNTNYFEEKGDEKVEKTKTDNEKKLNAKNEVSKHVESSYTRFPNRALSDDRLSKKDILVLLAICSYLNNKKGEGYNTCYPSRASIAKVSGYYRAQKIDDSICKLEEYGYIVKVQRKRGEKANASNLYKVVFAPVKTNPDAKETPKKHSIRKALEQIEIKEAETAPIATPEPEPIQEEKPKRKIFRKKETLIDTQELSKRREQAKELIHSWNRSLRLNEYTQHEEVNERNISYAMKALEHYDLPLLKELAEHIWGGDWSKPKGKTVDINIFNTGYMPSIIQSFEAQKKEIAERERNNPQRLREYQPTLGADGQPISKSRVFIGDREWTGGVVTKAIIE